MLHFMAKINRLGLNQQDYNLIIMEFALNGVVIELLKLSKHRVTLCH